MSSNAKINRIVDRVADQVNGLKYTKWSTPEMQAYKSYIRPQVPVILDVLKKQGLAGKSVTLRRNCDFIVAVLNLTLKGSEFHSPEQRTKLAEHRDLCKQDDRSVLSALRCPDEKALFTDSPHSSLSVPSRRLYKQGTLTYGYLLDNDPHGIVGLVTLHD